MSKIEWTEKTWNPIVGCSVVSPGCTNCYAMKMAARLEAMRGDCLDDNGYAVRGKHPLAHYTGTTKRTKAGPVWTGKVALASDHIITAPLRWKKPRRIFVNSMGDLFHESVPDEWINRVFSLMVQAEQHTFMVLTKRSARMRKYMTTTTTVPVVTRSGRVVHPGGWPLSNVWMGVTAEDQQRANERIPDLLATPAAVRFVSIEPMLGAIDLEYPASLFPDGPRGCCSGHDCGCTGRPIDPPLIYGVDWVICGGESGPNARTMRSSWVRGLRDQCAAAGVPFFFKQWEKRSGRLLDGVEHNGMPQVRS